MCTITFVRYKNSAPTELSSRLLHLHLLLLIEHSDSHIYTFTHWSQFSHSVLAPGFRTLVSNHRQVSPLPKIGRVDKQVNYLFQHEGVGGGEAVRRWAVYVEYAK